MPSLSSTPETRLDPIAQEALFAYYGIGQIAVNDHAGPFGSSNGVRDFTPETQRAYPFTTENMTDYFDQLDLADKDIAAICGSNDFALNAFGAACRSVDAVDAMQTACLYGELKTAGLAVLGRSEFLEFFNTPGNDKHLDQEQYERLRPYISGQSAHFFDRLLARADNQPFNQHNFFINKLRPSFYAPMNPYLRSEEAYERARAGIGNILFHATSMGEFLASAKPASYDTVYFSNIFAYTSTEEEFDLMELAASRLKPGGEIIDFSFIYPDTPVAAAKERQEFVASHIGFAARHILGTVPHIDTAEPGDSGYKAFVSIQQKQA